MKELNPSRLSFSAIILFVFFICVNSLHAQRQFEVAANPEAEYEIPYELPAVEGIKEVITRVLNYFETMIPYQVIDVKTAEVITDFSQLNPNAGVDVRTGEFNLWAYTMGVVRSGMLYAGEVTGNKAFTNYALKNYDFIFDHLPYFRRQAEKYGVQRYGFRRILDMHALDHCGAIGAALIQAHGIKKDPRYREMIDVIADYISNKQCRLEDGTLARQRPQAKSLWTDDFYMSIPFLAQMGKLTGKKKYWDDAVKQVLRLSERLFIPEKKLYNPGWNAG
jgi:unsaturated rhamnogalacturonyl hydrolase